MRGATCYGERNYVSLFVSIHAPMRGATVLPLPTSPITASFNPRAHAGRDFLISSSLGRMARFNPRAHAGRDFPQQHHSPVFICFNPRAHAGRDLNDFFFCQRGEFQSTRPCGARPSAPARRHVTKTVSIHAPMRGATRRPGAACATPSCFNPRAHAGRDRRPVFRTETGRGFNPRAHAGRDRAVTAAPKPAETFQSTRPCGARLASRPGRC